VPSRDNALAILACLRRSGVRVIASLPDAALALLIEEVEKNREFIHIPLTREEEGVGVCAGAYLAGHRTALIMQNAGLLNSCNGLATTALQFEIPMLLIVLYAGGHADMAFPQLGQVTEPVLSALNIPYYILSRADDAESLVSGALVQAYNAKKPVAVLVRKAAL
jgi:sulfopyruvate decarboxylase subunit alpha